MSAQKNFPKISIIINTDARVNSLAVCLESLQYLKYPNFEVVVVAGPTRDGTHELCESYGNRIVFGDCPERNLSMSRNISIHISSGEFVGFLDDDSVPEPEWLNDVMPAFLDPEVAVAGGFLHDHTGKTYQWKFGTLDRFGTADTDWNRPAPEYNFPGSFNYPHVMANSVFRRSAIVEAGGFDEEYEYFLDESDIILRFVDLGWKVAQLDVGFIHHKFMPSHIRNESKILRSWYSLVKNKTYFSLINNCGHSSVEETIKQTKKLIEEFRGHVAWAVSVNALNAEDADRFEEEVDSAFRDGLSRGLNGTRRLPGGPAMMGRAGSAEFGTLRAGDEQRCYVLMTRTYPPESVGGIGRYIHELALELGKLGHQVHVLTEGDGHDRVDFESGVWVHRIVCKEYAAPEGMEIPSHLWNYSRTMLDEAREIAGRRSVDAVYAPLWDLEAIAFLECREFKLVCSLQTLMAQYLDSNQDKALDEEFMRFAKPVLILEKRLLEESDAIHAISEAIVEEIASSYKVALSSPRVSVVPLGLEDWTKREFSAPNNLSDGMTRMVFVGRLESRKGADVFLSVVPALLARFENLHIDIVGNDSIIQADGKTYRESFEASKGDLCQNGRLLFHGDVSDERLLGFYQSADVIVAPSRFESFGLVHLEAMMFGKPIVGCQIGGMQEIIKDGETGLLAEPGDPESLIKHLITLVEDSGFCRQLGVAGREHYLKGYQPEAMAAGVCGIFSSLKTVS